MYLEALTAGQVVVRCAEEHDKVEVFRLGRQHISEIGWRLRQQHVIALEADLTLLFRGFAEQELAEARTAEAEAHAQAKRVMLLQERVRGRACLLRHTREFG